MGKLKHTDNSPRLGLQYPHEPIYNIMIHPAMVSQPPRFISKNAEVMAAGGNDLFASTSHGPRTSLWS